MLHYILLTKLEPDSVSRAPRGAAPWGRNG